ncbi:DNA polymerase subunit Cdc27 [Whalleya microplaca]|nr:DNA polymerase subunit Cdc27 [Whalleya microplaca]
MDDYRQYLAQKILTEDQLVTYRLLSRALKVHVNTAKEMLYEFHKSQNDKRPGTLHATYLVYGTKRNVQEQNGDVEMTDSQMSDDAHVPFSDEVPTFTLSLVKEEQLQEILDQYEAVTSIHVYSLAPHPLKDLQLLADTARQVLQLSLTKEVPNPSKVFGTISNPNVRKRERRGPAPKPVASTAAPKAEPKPQIKQEAKPAVKEEPKVTFQAPAKSSTSSAPAKKPAASSLKRQGSSGIGQMFAKAAAKPKKPAAKPVEEDTKMALSDDGEDDDPEPAPEPKHEDDNVARRSRKDRQAELRRMMDESDEEEEEPEKPETPAEEPMEEDEPPAEPETKAEEPAEVVSSTGDGRRRGRRRVTRKKQIMDNKGYLVTIQEPGWESFSEEEEAAPPKPKVKFPPAKSEPAAAKPKKTGAKPAQGNIMSFFSKK